MDKRLRIVFFILLMLGAVGAVSVYAFRNALFEALIGAELNKHNFPLQSIAALDLSFDGFSLRGLAAGENEALRVDQMRVTWDWAGIFAPNPTSIEISGLMVRIAINEEPVRASSSSLVDSLLPWGLMRLPLLSLKNSTVHFQSSAGSGAVALSVELTSTPAGYRAIDMAVIGSGDLVQGNTKLTATLDPQGNLQGSLNVTNGVVMLPEFSIADFSGRASFSGDLRGLPDSGTGKLDIGIDNGRWMSESLQIEQFSISAPLRINAGKTDWHVRLRKPAEVVLGKIRTDYPIHVREPLRFSLPQADIEWNRQGEAWSLKHEVAAKPGKDMLWLRHDKITPIEAQIRPGKMTFTGKIEHDRSYQGQMTIGDTALLLPQLPLEAQAASIAASYRVNVVSGIAADFAIEQLQFMVPQPLLAPLSLSGSIRNRAAAAESPVYTLNLDGGSSGLHYLRANASYTPDRNDGRLAMEVGPLDFLPDGLQPGRLFPVFNQWETVTGRIGASAQISWLAGDIASSHATVDVRDFSFKRGAAAVEGLVMSVTVDDLLTFTSPPHQAMTARRIDLGIPIEHARIYYQLKQIDPLRIFLEQAQFSLLDGRVTIASARIDPEKRSDLVMSVNDFDLEALFNLMQIDGLSGTGHLDGRIPLTLTEDQVIVRDGYLTAKTPGVLHFKSDKAAQYLASSGEEMNLVLQTLQNFYYTELAVHVDKSATDDLSIKLSLLGSNPAVKDGQNFRLNINLKAELNEILRAIDSGRDLSREILGGSFRFH